MKQKNGDEYTAKAQQLGFTLEKSYEEYKEEYKSIVKTMQEFFDGNTKSILKQVEKEIHKAASRQQFERCVQLRDMYRYIETLSEKQEVVFSRPVTGNVIHIEQIHSYWVVIFVKFFEGKIIDIIRERKPIEEADRETLIATCKAELMNNEQ
jgi:excinuclease ABC subunit C